MSYSVVCSQCDKCFNVCPSRYIGRNNFFCCKKCEAEYKKRAASTKVACLCAVCGKAVQHKPSYVKRVKNKFFTCSLQCMGLLRKTTMLGRNNPNCRYDFDDDFFKSIDNQRAAYILGWIGSDGHVSDSGRIEIGIKDTDVAILEEIRNVICRSIPLRHRDGKIFLTFNSKTMVADICRLLRIVPGKKDRIVRMPLLSEDMTWHFLRGYFDGDGTIRNPFKKNRSLDCGIASCSDGLKEDIKRFCNISCTVDKWSVLFYGNNAMQFMTKLYKDSEIRLLRKYEYYSIWLGRKGV